MSGLIGVTSLCQNQLHLSAHKAMHASKCHRRDLGAHPHDATVEKPWTKTSRPISAMDSNKHFSSQRQARSITLLPA